MWKQRRTGGQVIFVEELNFSLFFVFPFFIEIWEFFGSGCAADKCVDDGFLFLFASQSLQIIFRVDSLFYSWEFKVEYQNLHLSSLHATVIKVKLIVQFLEIHSHLWRIFLPQVCWGVRWKKFREILSGIGDIKFRWKFLWCLSSKVLKQTLKHFWIGPINLFVRFQHQD